MSSYDTPNAAEMYFNQSIFGHLYAAIAGVPHDLVVYPGAAHAFFNDTGGAYNMEAATDAWARTLAWFREYLPAG